MNIVILTNTFAPHQNGIARSVESAAAEYRRQGHRVLVIAPQLGAGARDESDTIRVPVFQKSNGSDLSAGVSLPSACLEQLQDFSPDVVHSHQPFLLGAAAVEIAARFGIPLVYTHHTWYEHASDYAPDDEPILRRLAAELQTGYCNLADGVFARSAGHAAGLRQRGVTCPVHVIPTGIDLDRFSNGDGAAARRLHEIPPEAWVIGYAGRLENQKNVIFLGRAIARFLVRNRRSHCLIVGEGSARQAMQECLKSSRVADRAHFAGTLRGDDLIDAYAAMDTFAFASRTETQGLAVLEALAAGVPVVAVDAPGVHDVVRDGENGRLLPYQSRMRFVAALEMMAAAPDHERWRAAARESAAQHSSTACAGRAFEIYSQLIESKAKPKDVESSAWQSARRQIEIEWELWNRRQHSTAESFAEGSRPSRVPVLRHFVWLWRGFRRWMSRREWSVALLDLPVSEGTTDEPGLVLLQIDGLSRPEFERAIDSGRMPFLRSLRRREFYSTHTMYSGQPTTTPAVLAELFYGVEQAVPAFGFRDHRSGEVVQMFQPGVASRVQRELAAKGEGLLAGGVAYCDIYSGGADDSSFCPATTGWRNLEDAAMWRRIVLMLLNVMSLVRIAGLCVIELVVAVGDFFRGIVKGRDFWRELLYIPRRVIVNIVLREFIGISAEVDVTRGVRAVHANFLGYDENAHRRGPEALFAHYALSGIDRAIRRIWDAAHASHRRSYHVWIMSDHGQQRTIPYADATGRKIGAAVAEIYNSESANAARPPASPRESDEGNGSADQQRDELQRSRWMRRGKESGGPQPQIPAAAEPQPTTVAIGPLGYIYWPDRLQGDDFDRLARRLVAEAEIPLVMANVEGTVWAWTTAGRYRMPEDAAKVLAPHHPFLEATAADFTRLCSHPDAGDFVVSGWRNDGLPTSFVAENGAHGGPGPLETQGFVMLSADAPSPADLASPFRPKSLRQIAEAVLHRKPLAERLRRSARPFLRIATYNVHNCLGMDGRLSPSRIARVLAAAEPDVVALQELDVLRDRTRFIDQAEQIAQSLEMQAHFHPSFHVEEGQYGNAILSRFPARLVRAGKLPQVLPLSEPRGALWVEITVGEVRLQVINTHLGLSPVERHRQVEELLGDDWLQQAQSRGPVILCGDFNAGPRSPGYQKICARLHDAQTILTPHRPRATWLSRLPLRRLDHVFIDEQIRVTRVDIPRTRLSRVASDHLPLIVDLELTNPPKSRKTTPEAAHRAAAPSSIG